MFRLTKMYDENWSPAPISSCVWYRRAKQYWHACVQPRYGLSVQRNAMPFVRFSADRQTTSW